MVRYQNVSRTVDINLCKDADLGLPETIEKCGMVECPSWTTTEWTPCHQSRCLRRDTAVQKRDVLCKMGNDTQIERCDDTQRPVSRQECYNSRCKAVWRYDAWSEVSAENYKHNN